MRLLLDINDNKAIYLLEILKSLPFVKTKLISNEKAILIEDLKESINELNLIKEGKLKGISAKDLLDEL
ncbi:MAG: hypothetical protein HYU67_09785 [Flavobacteriia bacterium]|nr:hypothetical protein [Flavobacteriia bacterium]